MLRVGLTGNIASGKSTAASIFAGLGAQIIDADQVVHGLLRGGTDTHSRIVKAFGAGILAENGEIDRKRLGSIVFVDAEKRSTLNALIHPAVEATIENSMCDLERTSPHGIVIVDAALIVETGRYGMYHRLIVVKCSPTLQIARIMSRDGLSEADARARMASQMPIEEKLKLADYVIDTSDTMQKTQDQVENVYRDLLAQESLLKGPMRSSGGIQNVRIDNDRRT